MLLNGVKLVRKGDKLEGFLIQLGPVGDAAYQSANMDKIEVIIWISPILVDIIDFKPTIWWHKAGLDR
jgi:hypothetical protein